MLIYLEISKTKLSSSRTLAQPPLSLLGQGSPTPGPGPIPALSLLGTVPHSRR